MKKTIVTVGVICIILTIIACFVKFVFWFFSNEEKVPLIKEGEFPFVVEYELNGKTFIIEDTVVCEFDGYDLSSGPPTMSWKEYLKSGDESKCIILKHEDTIFSTARSLVLSYGIAEYYMGDPQANLIVEHKPEFIYRERLIDSFPWRTKLTKTGLEKLFGIKLTRFEFSEPIENEFK